MIKNLLHRFAALHLLGLLLLAGCVLTKPNPEADFHFAEHAALPHKVAVLPFANATANPDAPVVVRKIFYNFLSSLNFHDVELYTVDEVLTKKGLLEAAHASGEPIPLQEICQYLGADAVVTGRVTQFSKVYALVYTDAQVGLEVSLNHCNTGEILWQRAGVARERDGDIPLSPASFAASLVTNYMTHLNVSLVQVAAKLCMDLVAAMPNPDALAEEPPEITLMVHSGAGRLLRPGDALRVVLVGDPGHRGTWDVSERIRDLPLKERERGIYVGEYVVQEGNRELESRLVGRLVSHSGVQSHWIDVLAPVTLADPTPLPGVIEAELVLTEAQSPYLASGLTIVAPGAALIAEAGAAVWFKELGLVVRGTLRAEGEGGRPVRFSSMDDSPWKGIFLDHTREENRLVHSEIRGARFGINARGAKASIEHSLIIGNAWGVVATEGSELSLNHSVIRASTNAGLSARRSLVTAQGCVISENAGGGAQFEASQVSLSGNALHGNGKWDLSNRDPDTTLAAPGNWWGTTEPTALRIEGLVETNPMLEAAPEASTTGG